MPLPLHTLVVVSAGHGVRLAAASLTVREHRGRVPATVTVEDGNGGAGLCDGAGEGCLQVCEGVGGCMSAHLFSC